jgi:hypothetical protein
MGMEPRGRISGWRSRSKVEPERLIVRDFSQPPVRDYVPRTALLLLSQDLIERRYCIISARIMASAVLPEGSITNAEESKNTCAWVFRCKVGLNREDCYLGFDWPMNPLSDSQNQPTTPTTPIAKKSVSPAP